ncbi:lipocalin family protein [Horticoccus sp. 23ND18S-11]|uniref:lipocalin family protein n=1 Tax=Horticoccus sp. 23ND18S-11 TaxID=3391832 RepID=UPI0039C98635
MIRHLVALACLALFSGCTTMKLPPLRTVPQVDLDRYLGDWNVIAHIPYFLEKGKVATLDRYARRPDGRFDNIFVFRRGSFDAPEEQWKGVAWVHDKTTNAEWRVQFIWPVRLAYLIIDLDPDYRWAVVGHPSRNYIWILARDRQLPDELYRSILQRAAAQGYAIDRIAKVPQPAP